MTNPPLVADVQINEDGSKWYVHPVTGDKLLSVTSVQGATEGKHLYLSPWSRKLTARFCVDHHDQIAQIIADKGVEEAFTWVKGQVQQLAERKADVGKYVHRVAELLALWGAFPDAMGGYLALPDLPDHLVGVNYDDEPLEPVVDAMIAGFTNFIAAFNPEFLWAEMKVYNRDLGVAGTLDMIIILRGYALTSDGRLVAAPGAVLVLCVDIKTGKYLDAFAVHEQLAAYRRMKEAWTGQDLGPGELISMPATDAAAVLHLRPEYPERFRLMPIRAADDAAGWNRFRRAVELQLGREAVGRGKPGKVAYPLREDGTMPAPLLRDLDLEGYGHALSALIGFGLRDLEEVSAWSQQQLLQIPGIGEKTALVVARMLADYGYALKEAA